MEGLERITVVSNRLPIVLNRRADGEWDIEAGSGGLVQAMEPILKEQRGTWIGWPGAPSEEIGDDLPLEAIRAEKGYGLEPVLLNEEEIVDYYEGFANSIVWPLFHGFPDRCNFDPEFWECYLQVNRKFADVIAENTDDEDSIWIHDYHLIHAAEALRKNASPRRVGFFLHIPFPHLQNYVMLPWRADLLRAFLSYDLIGFQTGRDQHNFLDCVERLMPEARVIRNDPIGRIELDDREVWVGAFPISIDFEKFSNHAQTPGVAEAMKVLRTRFADHEVVLGVDRLDYSKGLLHRLRAFERALDDHEELRENVIFFQLVVPSREQVPEYAALKEEVDRIIGRINGKFGTTTWEPVHYMYNTVEFDTLLALYRLSSVALVTPLCDGMNLVSKEYCACHVDNDGVLILGEMAGAASQLADAALLVNPHDVVGTARTIYQALTMEPEEKTRRMQALRESIRTRDVFWWAGEFIRALEEPRSSSEAETSEYLPQIDSPSRRG